MNENVNAEKDSDFITININKKKLLIIGAAVAGVTVGLIGIKLMKDADVTEEIEGVFTGIVED